MIYSAKLKTRHEMERTIQTGLLDWWHEMCPGQTLELRDATHEDIERCTFKPASSRDPADYLCENVDRGGLVLREAIAALTPWTEEQMDGEVRKAIQRLGAERFRSALGAAPSEALDAAFRRAEDVLESVRGNINPERGFCDELEAGVETALGGIRAALADRVTRAAPPSLTDAQIEAFLPKLRHRPGMVGATLYAFGDVAAAVRAALAGVRVDADWRTVLAELLEVVEARNAQGGGLTANPEGQRRIDAAKALLGNAGVLGREGQSESSSHADGSATAPAAPPRPDAEVGPWPPRDRA